MTQKPRKAMYELFSSRLFLIASIFISISVFFSLFVGAGSYGGMGAIVMGFLAGLLSLSLNAIFITGIWLLFAGARKKKYSLISIGFTLFSVYNFITVGLLGFAGLVGLIATFVMGVIGIGGFGMAFIVGIIFVLILLLIVAALILLFLKLGLVARSFSKTANLNKNLASYPKYVAVLVIVYASVGVFGIFTSFAAFVSTGFSIAAVSIIMVVTNKYNEACPELPPEERKEIMAKAATPEGLAELLAEANSDDEGVTDTPTRVENNEEIAFEEAFASLELNMLGIFEKGITDDVRFKSVCNARFNDAPDNPVVLKSAEIYDDAVSGRRLLRLTLKNRSPLEVSGFTFSVILADEDKRTLGTIKCEDFECKLASEETILDEYAIILPDTAGFGVFKLNYVSFTDGLYWNTGSDYYRFRIMKEAPAKAAEEAGENSLPEDASVPLGDSESKDEAESESALEHEIIESQDEE